MGKCEVGVSVKHLIMRWYGSYNCMDDIEMQREKDREREREGGGEAAGFVRWLLLGFQETGEAREAKHRSDVYRDVHPKEPNDTRDKIEGWPHPLLSDVHCDVSEHSHLQRPRVSVTNWSVTSRGKCENQRLLI